MFEHLPTIPCSDKVLDYDRKKQLETRWLLLRGNNKVVRTKQFVGSVVND